MREAFAFFKRCEKLLGRKQLIIDVCGEVDLTYSKTNLGRPSLRCAVRTGSSARRSIVLRPMPHAPRLPPLTTGSHGLIGAIFVAYGKATTATILDIVRPNSFEQVMGVARP